MFPDTVRLRGGVHGRVGGVDDRGRLTVSGVGYMSIGLSGRIGCLPFPIVRLAVVGDSGASGTVNGNPFFERALPLTGVFGLS